VERLSRDLARIVREPAVRAKLVELGAEPAGGTPDELAAFVRAEQAKWGAVVRDAHIKTGLNREGAGPRDARVLRAGQQAARGLLARAHQTPRLATFARKTLAVDIWIPYRQLRINSRCLPGPGTPCAVQAAEHGNMLNVIREAFFQLNLLGELSCSSKIWKSAKSCPAKSSPPCAAVSTSAFKAASWFRRPGF
jgi:hypothetical protein